MINGVATKVILDDYILRALREDITNEDISTAAVMRSAVPVHVDLLSKQDGVLCGIDVFERVFQLLDEHVIFTAHFRDGDRVRAGDRIGVLAGDGRAILSGERTALNFLQRMSGIATLTRSMTEELTGFSTKLLDTRKTTPNMRPFEKYAVKTGADTITAIICRTAFSSKTITSVPPVRSIRRFVWQKSMHPLSEKSKSRWRHSRCSMKLSKPAQIL